MKLNRAAQQSVAPAPAQGPRWDAVPRRDWARPPAAASRAPRRAPAYHVTALKAARCRSICGCRSAGSTIIFANDFASVNVGRIQAAIDRQRLKNDATLPTRSSWKPGLTSRVTGRRAPARQGRYHRENSRSEVAGASPAPVNAVEKAGGQVKTTFTKPVHLNRKANPASAAAPQRSAAKRASRTATPEATYVPNPRRRRGTHIRCGPAFYRI